MILYKQPITCNLKKNSIKLNTESHLFSLVYKMHASRNGFVVFQKRDAYIIDLFISGYCIFRDQCQKPLIRLCFEIRRKTNLRFAFTEVYCSCMKLIILYINVHKEITNWGCILIILIQK